MYLCEGKNGTIYKWLEIGNFVDIPQSNWENNSTTVNAYIQKRPAIRRGSYGSTDTIATAIIENDLNNNKAISAYSHASGYKNKLNGNLAGCKGYIILLKTIISIISKHFCQSATFLFHSVNTERHSRTQERLFRCEIDIRRE